MPSTATCLTACSPASAVSTMTGIAACRPDLRMWASVSTPPIVGIWRSSTTASKVSVDCSVARACVPSADSLTSHFKSCASTRRMIPRVPASSSTMSMRMEDRVVRA